MTTGLQMPAIRAKGMSAQLATILERIGAHHVVFPEHEMGERVAHLASGHLLDSSSRDDPLTSSGSS